jgi:hypothetical protein
MTTKIIIVEGQRFSVPAETDIETVRQHLLPNFPGIAQASLQKGKETIDGAEVETIEFVKKAGTKGLNLVDSFSTLPEAPYQPLHMQMRDAHVLHRLTMKQLTIAEALPHARLLEQAIATFESHTSLGEQLCQRLAVLPADAVRSAVLGW